MTLFASSRRTIAGMIAFASLVTAALLVPTGPGHADPVRAGVVNDVDSPAAIRGYDPVAYSTDHHAVKGSREFSASYEGTMWYFDSAAHRDAFLAEPARFAPQYGGFCAYAVSQGHKAVIDPDAFTFVDRKLYLNYDKRVQETWSRDMADNIRKGDANWPQVAPQTEVNR